MHQINQSTYDYLERLQLEYIVYELRKKIYRLKKDREYCKKVIGFKQEKIEEISQRNGLPTIFTSTKEKERLRQIIYIKGFPNFSLMSYKSDQDKVEFEEKDLLGYYNLGFDFKIEVGLDEFKIGKLIAIYHEKQICEIKLRGSKECITVAIQNITRII